MVKMSMLPKSIYRFNAIPIKIPASYHQTKFIWRGRSPRMANTTLKKKNKVGGLTLLTFKTY